VRKQLDRQFDLYILANLKYILRTSMGIFIRDPAAEKAIRQLAAKRGTSLTEAVRQAVDDALAADSKEAMMRKIDEISARLAKFPKTGLEADKAFYDWLAGEE
jgi:antitoxin VapB